MKKFKMNFSKSIYAVLWFTAALMFAGGVFDFLAALEVGSLKSAPLAVSVSATVACFAVFAAVLSLIFGNAYYFKNQRFYVQYGFFSMYLENRNVTEIKHNTDTNEVFLLYLDANSKVPDKIGIVKANVKKDETDEFLRVCKRELPKAIFSSFTKKDFEN